MQELTPLLYKLSASNFPTTWICFSLSLSLQQWSRVPCLCFLLFSVYIQTNSCLWDLGYLFIIHTKSLYVLFFTTSKIIISLFGVYAFFYSLDMHKGSSILTNPNVGLMFLSVHTFKMDKLVDMVAWLALSPKWHQSYAMFAAFPLLWIPICTWTLGRSSLAITRPQTPNCLLKFTGENFMFLSFLWTLTNTPCYLRWYLYCSLLPQEQHLHGYVCWWVSFLDLINTPTLRVFLHCHPASTSLDLLLK